MDIWVEGQSWTEPACGFIPSVLTRLDHLTEAGSEDPEISLRVHLVDLDMTGEATRVSLYLDCGCPGTTS